MSAIAALRLVELDTEASSIEAAVKRVRLTILASPSILRSAFVYASLRRTNRIITKVRMQLSQADVRTEADRAVLRDIADSLGHAAIALDAAYQEGERIHVPTLPLFGRRLMALLEHIAVACEDMAETAALGASEAFAHTVAAELRSNLEASRQRA